MGGRASARTLRALKAPCGDVAMSLAQSRHGWRAKCLQRLIRMELPVPRTVALPFEEVPA